MARLIQKLPWQLLQQNNNGWQFVFKLLQKDFYIAYKFYYYAVKAFFFRLFYNFIETCSMAAKSFAVFIDKITSSIEEVASGQSFDTHVQPVTEADLKAVTTKAGWLFNWKAEAREKDGRELFKLVTLKQPDTVQCLISCRKAAGYYFIPLIETAPHNFGRFKSYYGAPANMVAFVCKLSFEAGFGGVVSFTPKTRLIRHYKGSLGAVLINKIDMAIYTKNAQNLVNSYYK
jgi:hypothetical protein